MIRNETSTFTNILIKQLKVKEVSSNILEFRDPKEAVLFSIHQGIAYFPTTQGRIGLFYDSSFWQEFNYLPRYKDVLGGRKYIYIDDYFYIMQKYPSSYTPPHILNLEFESAYKTLERHFGIDPIESIITFTGGEAFYTVAGSFILRELGYILFPEGLIDPYICVGVPDLIAAKLGKLQEILVRYGVIKNGAFLAEVELWPIFGRNPKPVIKKISEEVLAIETEPEARRASGGRKQIETYLNSRSFNNGILICPGREGDEKYYGDSFITWSREGDPIVRITQPVYPKPENIERALKIMKKFVTITLLKISDLSKLPEGPISFIEFVERITSHPEELESLF
ncbi:hypothetical protein [Thermococcus sp.]